MLEGWLNDLQSTSRKTLISFSPRLDQTKSGYVGVIEDPITSISPANIERIAEGVRQTRYPNESILAHEFGHAIHLLADIYPQTTLPYPWNTNPVSHDYSGHMYQLP